MTHGTVDWIQVGSDDPEGAKRFYGELFGWTFSQDPTGGGKYDLVTPASADRPHGGIAHTDDASANHAVFMVNVSDVAAAAEATERLGGKVLVQPITTPTGLVFAHLLDPSGNQFGVYKPA
jgi:uncharacterized protein